MSIVRKKSLPCTLVSREMCAPQVPRGSREQAEGWGLLPRPPERRRESISLHRLLAVEGGGRHPLRPAPHSRLWSQEGAEREIQVGAGRLSHPPSFLAGPPPPALGWRVAGRAGETS